MPSKAILREVRSRGIDRLCHFTRVESLVGIMRDRHVWSTQRLLEVDPQAPRNDIQRLDGHLDYVSCSIEYPNLYVLDRFRNRSPDERWVILLLKPHLLSLPGTKFSPVNAAKGAGAHVNEGVDGFRAMYVDYPPSNPYYVRREQGHLKSCPTDHQAEVLVPRSIPMDYVVGAVVERAEDAPMARFPTTSPQPPIVKPKFFENNYVHDMIRMGHRIPLDIRQG